MKKITAINRSIDTAINIVKTKLTGTKMQEVDYNAAFASELPVCLNKSRAFSDTRFSGYFIHKSPLASFQDSNHQNASCEVGDMLAICHQSISGEDRYNAALIQWKMAQKGVTNLRNKEVMQLYLYEHWPIFQLTTNGGTYDIMPKTVTPGAQYGLIQDGNNSPCFSCVIPSNPLLLSKTGSFARLLINLMRWQTGRPFTLDLQNVDDWSRFITHLITVSLKKSYSRKTIGRINAPRGTDLLSFLNEEETINPSQEDIEDDAISLLYINQSNE